MSDASDLENPADYSCLRDEVLELREWKRQAMEVLSDLDLQEVGALLELPLGSSIAKEIVPYIKKTKGIK